jgi:hypothetical protein
MQRVDGLLVQYEEVVAEAVDNGIDVITQVGSAVQCT